MKKRSIIVGMMWVWTLFFMVTAAYSNSFYSVFEAEKQEVIAVFDNSTGNIVIHTPQYETYQVKVYDLTGKEVLNRLVEPTSQSTVVESFLLKKGLYLIRVLQEKNSTPLIFKVMVQ